MADDSRVEASRARGLVSRAIVVMAIGSLLSTAAPASPVDARGTKHRRQVNLTPFVNPFVSVRHPHGPGKTPIIGTSTNGNTFPGADLPFGMIQWSPDTESNTPGGYSFADHTIKGFSLTHLSGAGCRSYGDIPFLPTTASLGASPATSLSSYDSSFSHDGEQASPGYYGVELSRWGVGVQLTTTAHAGIGDFTYPTNRPINLLVNAGGSAAGDDNASVTVVGNNEVTGWATSGHFCGRPNTYTVHFAVQFDRAFTAWSVWNGARISRSARRTGGPETGVFLSFGRGNAPTTIQAKVGISFVSVRNALLNLQTEIPGWDFPAIRSQATSVWNAHLNTIQVAGGTIAERDVFYTALYHSMLFPSIFNDVNGQYAGFDGQVHIAQGSGQYANFSGWDIYRSQIPLLALLLPGETGDMMQSLVNDAAQGGWLPKWPVANSNTGVMNGDPADAIIAGAYAFGARGFDAPSALAAMIKGATHVGAGPNGYVERPGLAPYLRHGYIPYSLTGLDLQSSVATTLEYATDDFAIARFALALGDTSTWATFMGRAQNWETLVNPTTGFIQPRLSDGRFSPTFSPLSGTGFREGDAWHYTWMVPHNLAALFRALGGTAHSANRLTGFFRDLNGSRTSSHYLSSNEADVEAPWEFDFAGQPWNTQAVVRRIVTNLYADSAAGLPGNDDLGAMSSWYVWAAMGMYPEIPAVSGLALASPLFSEVHIQLSGGNQATILAPGASDATPYVTGMSVNGAPQSIPWLSLDAVTGGATIQYALSSTPDRSWGLAGPLPSYPAGEAPGIAATLPNGAVTVPSGGAAPLTITVQNVTDGAITVPWSVSVPAGSGVHASPEAGTLALAPEAKATATLQLSAPPLTPPQIGRIVLEAQGMAAGGEAVPLPPIPESVYVRSFASLMDNIGITADGATRRGAFDAGGRSYSSQSLAVAGLNAGGPVVFEGATFGWPADGAVGLRDNIVSGGQVIPLYASGTALGFLGAASGGPLAGSGLVRYGDGSTHAFTLAFGDWTLNAGSASGPPNGNQVAATLPYRNTRAGSQELTTYVFFASVPLDPSKTVISVRLPAASSSTRGRIHVFALAVVPPS